MEWGKWGNMEKLRYWAWDTQTRTIVGPKDTEDEINQLAFRTIDADFRIFLLNTDDKRKAVSQIKARLLEETYSLEQSMRRFHHIKREV